MAQALRDSVPAQLRPLVDRLEQEFDRERAAYKLQLVKLEQIVAGQDTLLNRYREMNATLTVALQTANDLADEWKQAASPSLPERLWRDLPKYAIGAGVGLLIASN
jgi:hypothetical protein